MLDFFCTSALIQLTTLTPSPAGAVGFPPSLGPMGRMWVHWFQPGIDCPLGRDSSVENFLNIKSRKMAQNSTFFQSLRLMRVSHHYQMATNVPTTSPWVLVNVGNQPYHSGMLSASSGEIGATYAIIAAICKNGTFWQRLKLMRLRYHYQMATNVPTTSP